MVPDSSSSVRTGIVAWIATVAIGTIWQLATRFGVTTTLTPIDLALLRYTIPAIVLLPLLMRSGFFTKGRSIWVMVLIVVGGGLPFGLLSIAGAQFAPVSHMGALLPGSMPVFVALLSAVLLGERFGWDRLVGLAIIIIGVTFVVGNSFLRLSGELGVLIGDFLFISAGVFWAVYTVAFRKSGLDIWHGAALICFWSSVFVLPIWFLSPNADLLNAPLADLILQILAQGIFAGLLGLAAYGAAIRHLGASIAAVSGAGVPALTSLGGFLLLGEPLTWLTVLGVVCVGGGIWAYAGSPGLPQSIDSCKRDSVS